MFGQPLTCIIIKAFTIFTLKSVQIGLEDKRNVLGMMSGQKSPDHRAFQHLPNEVLFDVLNLLAHLLNQYLQLDS